MKGDYIKNIRIKKGYTLSQVAAMTGYTPSYLSQIERDIKKPSLEALRRIADCLDTPLVALLKDETSRIQFEKHSCDDNFKRYSYIRKEARRKMVVPEINTEYQFLTPIRPVEYGKVKMLGFYIELKAGCWASEKLVTHKTEESIVVVEGQADVYVDDKVFSLMKGDSIYIEENVPHNIKNPLDSVTILIAYQSPALY